MVGAKEILQMKKPPRLSQGGFRFPVACLVAGIYVGLSVGLGLFRARMLAVAVASVLLAFGAGPRQEAY